MYPHSVAEEKILICLSEIEAKSVDWLWEPYLPKGMLALLSGDPGCGKTYLSLAIAAALSNGKIPGTQKPCDPVSTIYLSQENSAEYVLRPRFDSLGGDCSRLHLLPGAITLDDTYTLERAIVEARADLLIVDPIQSYLGASVDAHRSNETRPILDGLAELAAKYDCCILLVRHLSKSSGGRAIHRGLGSIDITGAARTELLAGSASGNAEERAMIQIKNNLGPYGDTLGYTIGESGFAWTGKSDLTINDLFAPDYGDSGQTQHDRAVAYVKAELASGPKLQSEIVSKAGYSARTLQRAAKEIGVKKDRISEGGPWRWRL